MARDGVDFTLPLTLHTVPAGTLRGRVHLVLPGMERHMSTRTEAHKGGCCATM